jgi:iron complex transport system ATP-binding protein
MDVKLSCQTVGFRYNGRPVLSDISFEVTAGTFCALLGRNGSGKTTLLHCLNALLTPCAGRILVNQTDIRRLSRQAVARQVSLVPQEHVDIFPFTVREVVVMGRAPYLGLTASPGPADYAMAEEALDRLNAGHLADCNFNRISGGERQIALLAGALVQSSDLVLLDEPTNHLDFHNQYRLLSIIKEICRGRGTSVVAAMHDPNLAMLFADQIIMLQNGRLIVAGETRQVMTKANMDRLYEAETVAVDVSPRRQVFLPKAILDE